MVANVERLALTVELRAFRRTGTAPSKWGDHPLPIESGAWQIDHPHGLSTESFEHYPLCQPLVRQIV